MCGIAGIYSYSDAAAPVDVAELTRIREHMARRGPDAAGLWTSKDGRTGLAHRRLAIIDLSPAGAQPMASDDGALVITFNGEIYNYRELRRQLEAKGVVFRSNSDTEVLLHLYAERGAHMVHALRGMYAFAIWDDRRKGLLLARDPIGIKPLYYSDSGGVFRCASQVKALLAGNGFSVTPDPGGYAGFHLWGHVPEPFTMYREVRALGSGCTMWVDSRGPRVPSRFFDVVRVLQEAESGVEWLDPREMLDRVRGLLLDSVRHHLVADVPVGVFQSSGIDSTVLTALTSELGANLKTVTLGFREYEGTGFDEVPFAERVAARYGSDHRTVWISRRDFNAELTRILDAMDQPSIDGVNSYFVSKAASIAGLKVAMSGIGGDELFGGYSTFKQVPRMVAGLSPFSVVPGLGKLARMLMAPLLARTRLEKYAGSAELGGTFGGAYLLRRGLYMPWELPAILGQHVARQGLLTSEPALRLNEFVSHLARPYTRIAALEMAWYMRNQLLRDADWAGMAHSLEVRVPYVDVELLKAMAPLLVSPRPPGKSVLASAPKGKVPGELLSKVKTGFTVPVAAWLSPEASGDIRRYNLRDWSRRVIGTWPSAGEGQATANRETVLVFRVGQLGDTLVSLPAIREIRRRHPASRMVLLTDRHPGKSGYVSSWDVLGPTGWFDEVLFYVPKTLNWIFDPERGSLPTRLRHLAPSVAYLLVPPRDKWRFLRDRAFMRVLAGVKEIHDAGIHRKPALRPHGGLPRIPPEWSRLLAVVPGRHERDDGFAAIVPEEERHSVHWLFREAWGTVPAQLIVLGPGSKMPAKMWEESRFLELLKALLGRYPELHVAVLGGPEDRSIGERLAVELGPRIGNFAGRLSIYGSAAAILNGLGYVGNDTGTMHLAAMMGKPCVALFSARDFPGHWEPYGEHHTVLRHDLDCAGCMLEVCGARHNECMKRITVEEVSAAVDRLLESGVHGRLRGAAVRAVAPDAALH